MVFKVWTESRGNDQYFMIDKGFAILAIDMFGFERGRARYFTNVFRLVKDENGNGRTRMHRCTGKTDFIDGKIYS
jgi:hypothetical protein